MKQKKSGSIFYVFLIPFILIFGIIVCFGVTYFYTTTTVDTNGKTISTTWAKDFTSEFSQYIEDKNGTPLVSEYGLSLINNNHLWLQIIDKNGDEILSCNKPESAASHYSPYDLVDIYQNGTDTDTAMLGAADNSSYTYIIGFPFKISKVITYVDTRRYDSGKLPIVAVIAVTFIAVVIFGIIYVIVISENLKKIQHLLNQIASRKYTPVIKHKFLYEIYDGINQLDKDIHEADLRRAQTERSREEWITNITHDLKTPLAPIKGYAEILSLTEDDLSWQKAREYGEIIGKNTLYAEQLINDLKLTYQLKNGIIPVRKAKQNLSRFVKELIIDILNNPDYENAAVDFDACSDLIEYDFDAGLLKRAVSNILINSIVHNDKKVDITVRLESADSVIIKIGDNGRGMTQEESEKLFDRYYRGTSTKVKPEGTGLGMAIAEQIVKLHSGTIKVSSRLNAGTTISIILPLTG
ncbi:MAG: HAMP domain-containing sensor histidine kinase [Oscillospiraceae bacterium]|nr:HAMP domain-containing sensor histidine kinase [Oscillospiraceae bacterium]